MTTTHAATEPHKAGPRFGPERTRPTTGAVPPPYATPQIPSAIVAYKRRRTTSRHVIKRIATAIAAAAIATSQCVGGCAEIPATTSSPHAGHGASPPAEGAASAGIPISRERATYYKQAFPEAARFVRRSIPPVMILPADKGNDNYIEAQNEDGHIIGYLRDFTGPVSPDTDCGCSPLSVTLIFDRDRAPSSILSPHPLEKYGHSPFTEGDTEKLINLLRDPPVALTRIRHTHDVVDALSGATRKELQPYVVEHAGLSTHRVVHLAILTSRILYGAPASRDRKRLESALEGVDELRDKARVFAQFIPTAESPELRRQVYEAMATTYVEALTQGADPDGLVEQVFLSPPFDPKERAALQGTACYQMVDANLRLSLVRQCVTELSDNSALSPARLAHLRGTLEYFEGDLASAVESLGYAVQEVTIKQDPVAHLRYAQTLDAMGRLAAACALAKRLYFLHPKLPEVRTGLLSCRVEGDNIDTIVAELRAEQRQALISQRRDSSEPAPALSLEGSDLRSIELRLASPGKATVLLFFATWCPHCRTELPRVISFVNDIKQDPDLRDRVRVIGVRTAVEREVEPYNEFLRRHAINFPIWVDSTLSMAFTRFARAHSMPTSLPTTVVLDEHGITRFILPRGNYRDTAQDIRWAVEAVLANLWSNP